MMLLDRNVLVCYDQRDGLCVFNRGWLELLNSGIYCL